MAKNQTTSFGLGSRIPVKPAEEKIVPETKTEEKTPIAENVRQDIKTEEEKIIIVEKEPAEYKTHRVQFVIKPSVYKKMKKYLKSKNQSFNDFICQYLDAFIEQKGL